MSEKRASASRVCTPLGKDLWDGGPPPLSLPVVLLSHSLSHFLGLPGHDIIASVLSNCVCFPDMSGQVGEASAWGREGD